MDQPASSDTSLQKNISDYVSWLYEHGLKMKLSINPIESISLSTFQKSCYFIVGDKPYPVAYGKNKKEAKEEAAKLVYQNLGVTCNYQKPTNYVGIVHNYCQKTGRSFDIKVKTCGPVHNPTFFCTLSINSKDYPEVEGNTQKEAKQKAAQQAWSDLQQQTDFDSKVSCRSTMSESSASAVFSSPTSAMASIQPESKNMTRSKSESFPDTAVPSDIQAPLRSTTSVDSPSLDSLEASSRSMPMSTSDSVLFTDSSHPSKEQDSVKNKNVENRKSETSAGSRFSSEFDNIERLAKGGYGRVYKAREILTKKYYAVKIVQSKEKALREVNALEAISHPNIVRYFHCWEEDSEYEGENTTDSDSISQSRSNSSSKRLYIKMELCDGKTLKDWINEKNNETLQPSKRRAESLPIAQQIVSGVEYIHSQNLIHRDLKPANIMFGLDKKVKIGDFGLVTTESDNDEHHVERTGNAGTKSYMAPEQERTKNYGSKVDIFSLGLIYFELLCKLSSRHEKSKIFQDIKRQIFSEEFLLNFPEEKTIITSMLSEMPEHRPEASKLKSQLEELSETLMAQNRQTETVTG
ncbi:interferon-induced, double-stranded RNA-activated protein kinase-like isoform 1-T2 [Pholidichthys leucotaenia]